MLEKTVETVEMFDHRIHEKLVHHRLSYIDQFFAAVTGLGSMYSSILIFGFLYVLRPSYVYLILPKFIVLTILVFGLKELFDRDKPEDSPLTIDLTKSFPSGHSSVSVFMAVSFSSLMPELAVLMYIVASLICISRVYLGAHYPSDVLAGATLGALTALLI